MSFDFSTFTELLSKIVAMLTPLWFPASHWIMTGLLVGFAIAHSGLAALRPWGESKLGARAYRVLFALVSIPFATTLLLYFFNHRYEGVQLWQLQGVDRKSVV